MILSLSIFFSEIPAVGEAGTLGRPILQAIQISALGHHFSENESHENVFAFKILLDFSAFFPSDHFSIEHPGAAVKNRFIVIQDCLFKGIKISYLYLVQARASFRSLGCVLAVKNEVHRIFNIRVIP
jgi:hypothetical protein